MSSAIFNLVAKKALKDAAQKNINSKDPYHEEVKVYDKHGRDTGRVKKQKKGVPPGVSAHDGEILKSVRRKAWRMDMSLFNCCGIRFGWSSVIGIVPAIGDVIDALMAVMVMRHAAKIDGGLPAALKSRMMLNIMLDFVVGLVPFVGDLADAVFRANTRNAWLLEEYLIKKAEEERKLAAGNPNNLIKPGATQPQSIPTPPKSRLGLFGGNKNRQGDEEMAMSNVRPDNSRSKPSSSGRK